MRGSQAEALDLDLHAAACVIFITMVLFEEKPKKG
jgi:hypothetical protein